MEHGPIRRRLRARNRIDVGRGRDDPGGAPARQRTHGQARGGGLGARPEQLAVLRRRRHDAGRVPQRHGGDRRLGARESGGSTLGGRRHTECELLEPSRSGRARRVDGSGDSGGWGGARSPVPASGQGARDQDESDKRRRQQRSPCAEQQDGFLAHCPYQTRRGRRRAQRGHDRGGREPGIERPARQIAVQPGDALGRIEHRAPRQRHGEQGQEETEVRSSVRVGGRQPTPESQRADPGVQHPDDEGG